MDRTYSPFVGVLVALGLIIAGIIVWSWVTVGVHVSPGGGQVACTMEAKLCPDGSYVGRSGPLCEFSPCPAILTPTSTLPTTDWKVGSDSTKKYSFSYPATLGTTYVSLVDWPPVLTVAKDTNVRCSLAGSETASSGKTERATINGREYCVTRQSEGAAGSMYHTYAYSFPNENDLLTLTFTLRFVQCMNYDEPNASNCTAEQSAFDADNLVDRMAQTVHRVGLLQ